MAIENVDEIEWGEAPPDRVQLAAPRRCRHLREWRTALEDGGWSCRCGHVASREVVRRSKNNRKRGNSHELAVARKFGGEKVGPLGLPEDIRGAEYRTQVKTHQRLAPTEWRKAFAALEAGRDGRTPRLIVRFLPGQGVAADDYVILRGSDWLDRFGRDDEEEAA